MAGRKLEHLNESIRQKLGQLLYKEANDPRFHAVTITSVKVSKDLSQARVEFSIFQKDHKPEEVANSLNHAAGFFSHALGRTLSARRTPRLTFHYDPGFDHAQDMDLILKQLKTTDG
jgi:ribosome-binding factor A